MGDDTGVTGVRIKNVETGKTEVLKTNGLFIAIGHKPNTDIFEGQLTMDGGYIETKGGIGIGSTATIFQAFSRQAMCQTQLIDRQSPQQDLAVWQRWMQTRYLDSLDLDKKMTTGSIQAIIIHFIIVERDKWLKKSK